MIISRIPLLKIADSRVPLIITIPHPASRSPLIVNSLIPAFKLAISRIPKRPIMDPHTNVVRITKENAASVSAQLLREFLSSA